MSQEEGWYTSRLTELMTDLYEITMGACYFEHAMQAPATFSLFFRKMPHRSFLVAAGLEEALRYLETLCFSPEAIDYLDSTGLFKKPFLEQLAGLRFTGDVYAVPEGTIVFPNEPLLEVTAPVAEAQLAETYLLNAVQLETLIATKAARVVFAARDRRVFDFASRRAHGWEAALKVARASYLAGFSGTSNVLAGKLYGIPIAGTLAHSFVQAFKDETEAFRAFARLFPDKTVLLIDTFDTLQGAHRAVRVGQEMTREGKTLPGVRLDSGDLVRLSVEVRKVLDEGGLEETRIFASGSLDEYRIEDLLAAGAPIDAFGVGSSVGVSSDWPAADIVYKLVDYDRRPVLKLSEGKEILAGRKQVFRRFDGSGRMVEDVLSLRDEDLPGLKSLLVPVMKGGKRLEAPRGLEIIRSYTADQFSHLPPRLRALRDVAPYAVHESEALQKLQRRLVQEHRRSGNG